MHGQPERLPQPTAASPAPSKPSGAHIQIQMSEPSQIGDGQLRNSRNELESDGQDVEPESATPSTKTARVPSAASEHDTTVAKLQLHEPVRASSTPAPDAPAARAQASAAVEPAAKLETVASVIPPAVDRLPVLTVPTTSQSGLADLVSPTLVAEPARTPEQVELYERAADDPGLAVTVLPHAAHLSIALGEGDLALHVRVRDGSADVNVSGPMSAVFDAKAPEVRTVLASEGLSLGSFATDHRQGQQGQERSEPSSPSVPKATTSPARPGANSGRTGESEAGIHVTA